MWDCTCLLLAVTSTDRGFSDYYWLLEWMLLSVFWLVAFGLYVAGLYEFVVKGESRGTFREDILIPSWCVVLLALVWPVAQIAGFFIVETVPWKIIMIIGIAGGIAVFVLGKVAFAVTRRVFFVLAFIAGLWSWYTWPQSKTLALATFDYVSEVVSNGRTSIATWWSGTRLDQPSMELAQAELERCLSLWKQRQLMRGSTHSGYPSGCFDAHHDLFFDLASWHVGAGKELEVGVYEFRLSMEVSLYEAFTFYQFFPEKVATVIKDPSSDRWGIFTRGGLTNEDASRRALLDLAESMIETNREMALLIRRGQRPANP